MSTQEPKPKVRVVAGDSHTRGAIGERIARDLLFALGYDNFRSVSRPGRQIDVIAEHHLDGRVAIGEAKATADRVGGRDISTFVGVAELERMEQQLKRPALFFISIGGFLDSARVAAAPRDGKARLRLIDGVELAELLPERGVVVSLAVAIDAATRALSAEHADLRLHHADLLAWEHGWVWALMYARTDEPSGYILVHGGDGQLLSASLAERVRLLDADLTTLGPLAAHGSQTDGVAAGRAYLDYLVSALDGITTQGLPRDEATGSRRLPLDDVYVPLKLGPATAEGVIEVRGASSELELGAVLHEHRHVAVLAPPGAGKTTLMRRLATAYARPERRGQFDDELPDEPLVPLLIRCRDLTTAEAKAAISDTLIGLANSLELSVAPAGFRSFVSEALQEQTALLLIDGLDEMNEDDRASFVERLRAFSVAYPDIRVLVTARPAGFRVVAPELAWYMAIHGICPLSAAQITALCIAWHQAVEGHAPEVTARATALADGILANERVHRLAEIPVLLVTLMLVNRGGHVLPEQRSVLYHEALVVLLRTWNTEGHRGIEPREAEPQLAWLAFQMAAEGRLHIAERDLRASLERAREAFPQAFRTTTLTVDGFAEKIEERSSILIFMGRTVVDGRPQKLYEFRHRTFLEYLAAVAAVDGYCPRGADGESAAVVLDAFIGNDEWSEIVPLAAALEGVRAGALIERIVAAIVPGGDHVPSPKRIRVAATMLGQCLIDEVQIHPKMVESVARALAGSPYWEAELQLNDILLSSYGGEVRTVVDAAFREGADQFDRYATVLAAIIAIDGVDATITSPDDEVGAGVERFYRAVLLAAALLERGETPLGLPRFDAQQLMGYMGSSERYLRFSAYLGLAVMGAEASIDEAALLGVLPRLVEVFLDDQESGVVRGAAARALSALPLVEPSVLDLGNRLTIDKVALGRMLLSIAHPVRVHARRGAALVIGYYTGQYTASQAGAIAVPDADDDPWLATLGRSLRAVDDRSTS